MRNAWVGTGVGLGAGVGAGVGIGAAAGVRVRWAHDGQQQLADVDSAGGPRLGVEATRLATHPRVVFVLAPLIVELLGQALRDLGRHLPGAVQGRRVGRRGLCAHNARGAAALGATVARRQLKGRHQRCGQREEKERRTAHGPESSGTLRGYAADGVQEKSHLSKLSFAQERRVSPLLHRDSLY